MLSPDRKRLHLGGPGEPDRALRDVLAARIRAVPAGGRIAWWTYYFRDRGLAQDLVDAHRRGVEVRVLIEGRTRTRGANRHVLAMLAPALGAGLRVVDRPHALRVHAKLYLFDGPEKQVLLGSFNPSGDAGELDPGVVREIGDQDRGFNLLVESRDGALVDWLFAVDLRLHRSRFARLGRLPLVWPRRYRDAGDVLWLLPRFTRSPLLARLGELGPGTRVRMTATHLSGRAALRHLGAACARGARIEVLGEFTERRVPRALEARLGGAGVEFTRVALAGHLPMHAKFMLIEAGDRREAWYGSANWSDRSFYRNFEILARTADAGLFDGLSLCWDRIGRLARGAGGPGA